MINEHHWDNTSLMHAGLGFSVALYTFLDTRHNYNGQSWLGEWHAKPYKNISMVDAGAHALSLVILVGLAQEISDGFMEKRGDGFSYRDWISDIVGGIIGVGTASIISYLWSKSAKE